jgi:hypothetical protein
MALCVKGGGCGKFAVERNAPFVAPILPSLLLQCLPNLHPILPNQEHKSIKRTFRDWEGAVG